MFRFTFLAQVSTRILSHAFISALLLSLASPVIAGPRVRIETTLGTMMVELNRDKAPITVDNFVEYARRGWYDGTLFHRVLRGAVIQGGGFTEDLALKDTRDTIENEANNGLSNVRGSIAMARTSDPHSAATQFFINLADNTPYDHRSKTMSGWGYCVFGQVIEGMEVADAIGSVSVHAVDGFDANVPVEPVVITRLRVLRD